MIHECDFRCLDENGKCTRHFPKPFSDETIVLDNKITKYKRRKGEDGANQVIKNGKVVIVIDDENREDLKVSLLEKIDNLMEELEDDGISLDKIPRVDYNTDLEKNYGINKTTNLLDYGSGKNSFITGNFPNSFKTLYHVKSEQPNFLHLPAFFCSLSVIGRTLLIISTTSLSSLLFIAKRIEPELAL